MAQTHEPLTSERLERMRERVERCYTLHTSEGPMILDAVYPDLPHDYCCDVEGLLADNERLHAALAAAEAREAALVWSMRQLLEIATLAQFYAPGELGEFPETVASHIDQARALLAATEAEGSAGDG